MFLLTYLSSLFGRQNERTINAWKVVSEVFNAEKLLMGLWEHRFASHPFKIRHVYHFLMNLFQSRFGTITFANMQKKNKKYESEALKCLNIVNCVKHLIKYFGRTKFFCKNLKNKRFPNIHQFRREQKLQPYMFSLKEMKARISNSSILRFEKNWTPDLAFAILTQAYISQKSVIWISFLNHAPSRLSSIPKSSALHCGRKNISGKK